MSEPRGRANSEFLMNPLTHSRFSLQWLQEQGFRTNENLVILGSILPDLAYMGFIPEKEAHTKGVALMQYLQENDPAYAPLGVGFMLHGEKPFCLDYFTHRPKGYIAQKSAAIRDVLVRARFKLKQWYSHREEDLIHSIIEFSGDTLMDGDSGKRVQQAFLSVDLARIAGHLALFFERDEARILRALQFFRRFNFQRLQNTKGVVHAMQDFSIVRAFSQKNNTIERYNAIMNRLNPWRTHKLVKILNAAQEIVGEDYREFLAKTQEKVRKHTARHAGQVFA